MTRPAYVEIDLARLFTEELYVDFTVFWLLLHATRFEPQVKTPESCLLEECADPNGPPPPLGVI